jgi:hypothetical protein
MKRNRDEALTRVAELVQKQKEKTKEIRTGKKGKKGAPSHRKTIKKIQRQIEAVRQDLALESLALLSDSELEKLAAEGNGDAVRRTARVTLKIRREAREAGERQKLLKALPNMSDDDLKALAKGKGKTPVHAKARELWAIRAKAIKKAALERMRREQALRQQYNSLPLEPLLALVEKRDCDIVIGERVLREKTTAELNSFTSKELSSLSEHSSSQWLGALAKDVLKQREQELDRRVRDRQRATKPKRSPYSGSDHVNPDWWRERGE